MSGPRVIIVPAPEPLHGEIKVIRHPDCVYITGLTPIAGYPQSMKLSHKQARLLRDLLARLDLGTDGPRDDAESDALTGVRPL